MMAYKRVHGFEGSTAQMLVHARRTALRLRPDTITGIEEDLAVPDQMSWIYAGAVRFRVEGRADDHYAAWQAAMEGTDRNA